MPMNDNLARNYENTQTEVQQPEIKSQPQIKTVPAKRSKSWLHRWSRGEKFLATSIGVMFFGLSIYTVNTGIEVGHLNRTLQDTNEQIADTEVVNTNLEQNIQELTQYDRVFKIAEKYGLEMNDQNVRNVGK